MRPIANVGFEMYAAVIEASNEKIIRILVRERAEAEARGYARGVEAAKVRVKDLIHRNNGFDAFTLEDLRDLLRALAKEVPDAER